MVNLGIYGARQWFALTGQTILGTADTLHPLGTADEDDTIAINAIPTFTESPTFTLGDGEAVTITTTDVTGGAVAPFVYTSNMDVAGATGGRALFTTVCNAAAGNYINALKGYMNFDGTSGSTSGLASGICAELITPNRTLPSGAYYPLEVEYVAGGTSVTSTGSGSRVGFIWMQNTIDLGGDFDINGYLMTVGGLTAAAGSIYSVDSLTLRCQVGLTGAESTKYIPLSDAENCISFSYANSVTEMIALTIATTKVATTGMSMSGAGTYTNAIVLDADAITTSGIAITTSTPVQGILISAACSTAGINISGAEAVGMSINTSTPTSGILISSVCETAGINLSGGSVTGIIIADASTAGMTVAVDTTSANNSKKGLTIAKNITDNVSAGAGLSATNGALEISSTNAKSASGDQILTIGNNLVSITETNSNALAVADVYSGALLALVYSATTTGNGTSTSTAKALSIDYNLTRTAGTLTVDDTNVVDIDVDFTGDVTVAASGDFHALNINIEDGTTVGWGTTSTCKGINLDMSGLLVADSDLTLTGIKVAMPSAYGTAAAEYAIYASGDGVNVAVCSDAAIGIAMTGVVVTGISLGGTLTTGITIGATTTAGIAFTGALVSGITFSGATLSPGTAAGVSDIALEIGSRTTQLAVDFDGSSGVENFEPVQMKINFTGSDPETLSKVNMIYQQLTHTTTDMANLRLKCADFTVTVAKHVKDVYAYQGEVQLTGDVDIGGQVVGMGMVLQAGTGTVTGSVCGHVIAMDGASMPAASYGIFMASGAGATLTNGIYIETQGGTTITYGLNIANAGTFTNVMRCAGTIENFLNLDDAGNSGFVTTGGTDCAASDATDPGYTIKCIMPDGGAGYIRVWDTA